MTTNETTYKGEQLSLSKIFTPSEKGYKIEIPMIQRDYAQGRKTAKKIRKDFLDTLYRHLKEDKPIDLDFVYGSVDKNQNFIPLDGQQRLTTLFLLHWYLANKENKQAEFKNIISDEDTKSKFTYETRISSREFCHRLVSEDIVIPAKGEKLSSKIEDLSWFFFSWKKDPTIASMLTMLDNIHKVFYKSQGFYEKLVHQQLITFQFIELERFKLTDNLYIKMNARGKPLTPFENFKAKFEQLLGQYDKEDKSNPTALKKEFSIKIDTSWTDTFWHYRDDENLFDKQLMNFIRVMVTNHYVIKQGQEKDKTFVKLTDTKIDLGFYDYSDDIKCFDKTFATNLIAILDVLHTKDHSRIKNYLRDTSLLNENELFNKVITHNLSYVERIQIHALYHYLIKYGDKNLHEWMRVVRNLTADRRLNEREYINSLKSINRLIQSTNQILEYLTNHSNTIKGLPEVRVSEECLKAHLILKNEEWKNAILSIEKHDYFNGQIGFLLLFSGAWDFFKKHQHINWSTEQDKVFFNQLNFYASKAEAIFDKNGVVDFGNFLVERALLVKVDYLLFKRHNYSFLVASDRDISWRRFLRVDTKRLKYLKELLDTVDLNDVAGSLQQIIDTSTVTDWRRHFILYPRLIEVCGTNKFIRWTDENNILLLSKMQTNGFHREYYSYALCQRLIQMGNKIHYVGHNRVREFKHISIINEHALKIGYYFDEHDKKWQYSFEDDTEQLAFNTDDDVIQHLKSRGII